MSEQMEVEQISQNDDVKSEEAETVAENAGAETVEKIEKPFEKRTYKTKHETAKESRQRAIDNFQRGIVDPEYKVVKMSNGKYRCYPRKEPLQPEPIKLNQIAENKKSEEIITSVDSVDKIETKSKSKTKDPFADIVYYNMSNQISEQLNKRLDAVNLELERLRHKNSKLKGKYKQLKQAIYITEEEDNHEDNHEDNQQPQPIQPQPQHEDIQQQQPIQQPHVSIQPTKRINTINFNRFFN